MKNDQFGDRMKGYEQVFTSAKIDPDKWMCVRIDGRGFSKFTKGFKKPFDADITNAMVTTTKRLVEETHASVGYTQSDEITLLFPPVDGERIFNGKVSKVNSVFASMATAHFNILLQTMSSRLVDKLAYFDCRVWGVPNDVEASNVLLWRVQDARKNSISSTFRWTAGAKLMHGLSGESMVHILENEYDVHWDKLPNPWKYGTYVKPTTSESYLTADELENIPEHKRPTNLKVIRRKIESVDIGYFGDLSVEQRVAFVK